MNGAARHGADVCRPADDALSALCAPLFASLPRSDQRERFVKYVEGLLVTEGRRSFRNMAACLGGGPTLEQRLHHFVSCSTWDWMPVRRALTTQVTAATPPDAWVLRPLLAPKEGSSTVGVHRRHVPDVGHLLNVQYAVGLWAVCDRRCHPVNWRLLLPRTWTADPTRRARTSIPEGDHPESPTECATAACFDLLAGARDPLPGAPVVVAVEDIDAFSVIRQLRAARLPFLVRVEPGDVPTVPGAGRAAPVRVRLPDRRADEVSGAGDLLLFHRSTGAEPWPDEVWLTDLVDADPAELAGLAASARAVDASFARVTDPLGARDFTGRTFDGWNRHMTLVSVAHTARTAADSSPRL
ncbi:IS701 family transposase [Streptomyces olivaceiscleroticus]|uniref:Transposase n=1 Tax=Streptomyces olivaceiscleroticus TaxID=68245 RepID=A0ABN1ABZ4_9ACTN